MPLVSKHIIVLSPQPWEGARISKHHYAVEMARRGNRVTFVAQASAATRLAVGGFEHSRVADVPNLEVLNYRLPFPAILKFKAPALFRQLMRWQARRIMRRLGTKRVDVVWDFVSSILFEDLRAFAADCYVFHPVDMVSSGNTRGAHVVISLTDGILGKFAGSGVPSCFVNHGLGEAFSEFARDALTRIEHAQPQPEHSLAVGYAGNLFLPCIDHANFRAVIERRPDLTFHFWGPHSAANNNLGSGAGKGLEFVSFLRQRDNVRLHGVVGQTELVRGLAQMDALVVCYDAASDPNGAANSHKILEYLSTGRVVISTHISTYAGYPGLLEMLPTRDNRDFPEHFDDVIGRLAELNAPSCQRRRISFALEHTYARQLDRIEQLLATHRLLD